MRKQTTPSETHHKSEQRRRNENLGSRKTKNQSAVPSGTAGRRDNDDKIKTAGKRTGSESNENRSTGRGEKRKNDQPGAIQTSNNRKPAPRRRNAARQHNKKQGNSI